MEPLFLISLILLALGIKGCLAAFEYALVALRYGSIRGENLENLAQTMFLGSKTLQTAPRKWPPRCGFYVQAC